MPAVKAALALLLLAGTGAALPATATATAQAQTQPQPQTPAQPAAAEPLIDAQYLDQAFANIAGGYGGSYGVYLSLLETGEEAGFNPDKKFAAASCHKLFLVEYVYELAAAGSTSLDRKVAYTSAAYDQGAGEIQHAPVGTAYTVRQLCELAIAKSDNIASNLLKRTYGYDDFRHFATSIGCPVTGVYDGRDMTTAREQGIILRRVMDFAATNPLGQEIVQFLKEDIYRSRIPAGVPAGVEVGNKEGDYKGCANDAAVVFMDETPYVLVVLSSGAVGDAGHVRFSRYTYNYLALTGQARRVKSILEDRAALIRCLLVMEGGLAD